MEEWCKVLLKRFKESTGVALAHLTAEKYTLANARSKREPSGYVQAVIRHAKSANINNVENQLTFAYQGIVADLQAFVDPPSATMSVSSFIQVLELKKDTWFEMSRLFQQRLLMQKPFRSLLQQPTSGYQNQGQQAYGQQQYGHQQPYSQQSFPSRPYSSYDQNAYRYQQFGNQPSPCYKP